MTDDAVVFHPVLEVQIRTMPATVVLLAYEVYCELYGPQPAIIDVANGCRGGFSTAELIAYLYARQFPRDQWHARAREALTRPPEPLRPH